MTRLAGAATMSAPRSFSSDGVKPLPASPGSSIGRYRLQERIGGGGFGDVYRASDPLLARTVAIKVLREARAASSLDHPAIVTIDDVGPFSC